ncbi:hypothetical protein LELG_04251 [Lodderomyces elongisporus NRRL YB-4239]|uniref:Oxidoreductase n=1 Tax=Lodderomyces elongisporus (strain ATCC 11503 / CBS 2605 / JCM 1781 / NBRC 1676 / NRRL YB-4239) TaxID=379508 RepID=A5E3R3_LODEL|nr:hypothetical protein LELG_04251 [Lodderomyces elongisporus NRRL YB-4239]
MSFGKASAERLLNKVVLITGATSGIGQAIAKELASINSNIKLIVTARRLDKLNELKDLLEKQHEGIKIHAERLDVSKVETIAPFIKSLPEEFANIDILVNNAGLALGREEVGEIDTEDIETMFQTNVLGLITMTQAVLPIMKKRNTGTILGIGSIASRDGYPGGSVYCATKASVRAFFQSLQKETISTKIRASLLEPGMVRTNFSMTRFKNDAEKEEATYKGGEPLTAEDIAEIAAFIVTRRENTVIAETLVFPTNQASSAHIYRAPE